MPGSPPRRRPYTRFTRWRRRRFFALLEESGNIQMAAELAGVGLGCIYRLRRVEPGFVALIDAACAKATARLAAEREARAGETDGALEEGLTIRRGRVGFLQVSAAGRFWETRHDKLFLAELAATGNVAAAARAAGFCTATARNRRKTRPGFAAGWDAALATAREVVPRRLTAELIRRFDPSRDDVQRAAAGPIDVEAAIQLLKWRDRKG